MSVLRRAAACALAAGLCACSHADAGIPDWLTLRAGVQARLDYSVDYDPEHANVFATEEAARASIGAHRNSSRGESLAPAGGLVTVESVASRTEGEKHVVAIRGATFSGWVVAEDALLPVPPTGAELIVPASISHVQQMLYGEQDDDDGVPVGISSRVRLQAFDPSPGNPEYLVKVEDGPLAGQTGYLFAGEIEVMPGRSFTLLAQRP
jgi:hypothetical protein